MNNENSGEVEDGQIESPLNDSINSNSKTCQAVAEDASESLKPPNSKIFQLQMDEIGSRIRETEEKLKSLDKQVLLSGGRINKSAAPVDKEKLHEELQDLRTQREKVIEERKQCDLELKGLNDQVRKKNDACTKLQAATRYKSEARIDEAVRRLEHQMQAQQLNLREEKRIVAEIDTLKRSKRSLKEYLDLKQHVDQLRNKQKHLNSQRDACVRRINGLKAREEKLKNQLDSADVCNENKEAKIQQHEHLNTIEILKKELDDLHSERRERKAKFSKETNDYYSAIRKMKSQKQREEATRRKNEKQTMMKAVVSSRATQQLYEKEKSLCDTLISYMEKLHTSLFHLPEIQGAASIDKEPVVSLSASADFSSSGEGMFLRRNLDADDLVGIFAGVHRISRKGSRKGRRSSAKEAPRKLNLHPEVVEHLLTLGLSPPSTVTDIPKVLGELHKKKEFYNNPPSSSSLLALASNDPMSPISEEATPEFPTKFEEKDASKTTDTSAQIESTAEKDEEGGENLHIIVPQSSLTEGHEVSSRKNLVKVNTESAENLNSLVPGTDENVSNVERVELEKSASSEISTDPAVASGNSENVDCGENHKLTNTMNEPTGVSVVFSVPSDNLCDSGGTYVSEDNKELNQLHSGERGSNVTVKLTLPRGFSVDSRNATRRTPLMNAALNGNVQVVKSIMNRGADPSLMDNRGWNALHLAAQGGDTDILSLIHSHLPNIESKTGEGYTPLMVAAFTGKLHAVKWFLEKGAAVTCECNRGWNTLHYAAKGGDTDVISLIHNHLPNIESKAGEGYTPLMVAAFCGKLHAVQWFLEKGATVACECNRGWNTLHLAAQGGDTDIISLIHTHLPNIESKTGEGYTPLMVAAFCGKLHAVQWFIERGANPWAKDNKGEDSFYYASSCDSDVLDLLKSHVAKSAAPHDSTEQTQRNKKEAWTATGTAVEDHEKEKVPYHTSRKDLADKESTTVDAVDDQKTLIRRGKIGGEEGTWHLREAGASIKLCSEAVQQPVPFTCRCLLWNPRTLSPPIASDEILVSSVIELSFDGPSDPEYRESVEGISFTVALLHSAPDLEGYEVVIKQLIDQENNEWKELKTENTWHGSETSTVTEWLFPFAQAVCAKPTVSSFATIWRPKSFTFSRGTAVGPELTCVVPDFPDVSVQIPQSCVPVNEDFCVTIKVQEFPSSELKGEGGLVGPCLYISGSQNVTLVAPVTIRIPLTLRKEKQELGELCPGELRILHCESLVEPHYWKDITDQLEEPPLLLDGIVQFKVRHFSGFRPTKLTRSLLQSAAGLIEFVRKLSCRHRPQHARFLTCLCKTSAPGQFGLKLFCYPQKLLYDVNQQVKKCKLHYIGEGSSHEPVCEEEISVYFPEAILFQGEDAKTTLKVVRFSNKRVVLSNWVVCLGSNSVPVVEFYDQSNELLCEVIMVLASEVLNRVIIDHEEGNDIHMVKDGVPTDCELEGLSEELAEKWEALGRRLEFNQSAIANFDEANKGLAAKAFKMLLAWKQKEGSKATYTVLYDALCHKYVKCKRLAEQFCWKKL